MFRHVGWFAILVALGAATAAAAQSIAPARGDSSPLRTWAVLARKAKQHNTDIIGSYWRRDEKGRGRYNSAVLIDRRGKLAGIYDKVYPTIGEMESGVLPGQGAKVPDPAMDCPERGAYRSRQGGLPVQTST